MPSFYCVHLDVDAHSPADEGGAMFGVPVFLAALDRYDALAKALGEFGGEDWSAFQINLREIEPIDPSAWTQFLERRWPTATADILERLPTVGDDATLRVVGPASSFESRTDDRLEAVEQLALLRRYFLQEDYCSDDVFEGSVAV